MIETCYKDKLEPSFWLSENQKKYIGIFADVSIYLTLSTRKSVTSCTNLNGHNVLSKQEFFMKLTLNGNELIILLFQNHYSHQIDLFQIFWWFHRVLLVLPRGNKLVAMTTQVAMKISKNIKKTDFHNFFFWKVTKSKSVCYQKRFYLSLWVGY